MVYLYSYRFINDNQLKLSFSNGNSTIIRLSENSGRIVTRKKVGSVSDVNHPGIYVGEELHSNEPFILHNHYKIFRTAGVSPLGEYAANQEVFWDNRICVNNKMQVLQNGLNQALNHELYHWLTYNCQTTVNDACSNKRNSEDVEKWIGRIAFGVLTFLTVRAVTS